MSISYALLTCDKVSSAIAPHYYNIIGESFLHGVDDDVVSLETVTNVVTVLQEKYHATDVTVNLLDGGDHRLSRSDDINAILKTLGELLAI